MDERYLDCKHTPVEYPLLKPTRVELYDDKWLQPAIYKIRTHYQNVNLPSSEIDALAFKSHAYTCITTVSDLQVNDNISPIIDYR